MWDELVVYSADVWYSLCVRRWSRKAYQNFFFFLQSYTKGQCCCISRCPRLKNRDGKREKVSFPWSESQVWWKFGLLYTTQRWKVPDVWSSFLLRAMKNASAYRLWARLPFVPVLKRSGLIHHLLPVLGIVFPQAPLQLTTVCVSYLYVLLHVFECLCFGGVRCAELVVVQVFLLGNHFNIEWNEKFCNMKQKNWRVTLALASYRRGNERRLLTHFMCTPDSLKHIKTNHLDGHT